MGKIRMTPKEVSKKAVENAKEYEIRQGRTPHDVQRKGGEYSGYDLVSEDSQGNRIKIEVKGTTVYHGIPDPYETEFKDGKLVADFLYVFYFQSDDSKPKFYKIPRNAIKSEDIREKKGWKIRRSFTAKMDYFEEELGK